MIVGRLLHDAPIDGPTNMAVDQALLQHVRNGGEATLRFYGWQPATLSLGYFQNLSDRTAHPESESMPVVRRSTGGGAIVHDRELTYSLTLAIKDRTSPAALSIYRQVHNAIRLALKNFGVTATPFRELPQRSIATPSVEPFLCFQRRTEEDLIVNGYKVVGSAQRRLDRALLQHGSILLRSSPLAPQLPGIFELTGQDIRGEELADGIVASLATDDLMVFHPKKGSPIENSVVEELANERFRTERWTARRR